MTPASCRTMTCHDLLSWLIRFSVRGVGFSVRNHQDTPGQVVVNLNKVY